ncbi:hypothetical protein KEM54_000084 [Ascosphaera aggregata]|nr:hypothetical protein KEM54_000084 [Ascosphaera aggregata]
MIELPPDFHDRIQVINVGRSKAPSPSPNSKDEEASTHEVTYSCELYRGLNSRHIQFYALSGAIGTGLFVGVGQVLSVAGPLSAFLVYMITGTNIFAVISCLGEMATWLPVSGGLPVFGKRFVDQSLGFAMGWNYYYTIAMGVPLEISAGALIIQFWPNHVPIGVWITILFVPMVIINSLPVRFYGETEFLFGAVKIITIIGLIILMLIIDLGGAPSRDRIGFRYWANPGPMNTYLASGALGRFLAFWKVFVQATFSYGGSETVIAAAGETKYPRKNIPRAVRRVFWRITIFYVMSVFFVGLCVSSTDSRLLNAIQNDSPGVAQSPFVIAITNGHIDGLPHLINALLLCSAWSSGNASFYVATRLLYATALEGNGPKLLTRTTKSGIPYACVALTTSIAYIGVPIFFLLYLGHKYVFKTAVVPIEKIDIWTGKDTIDRLEELWEEPQPRNCLEKLWYWLI